MPVRTLRRADLGIASRAAARLGLAASLVVLGCESLQNAVAEGDTRTISLHHLHTGEDLTITYKRNGRYDDDALKQVNWLLRDWRRNEAVRMDPRLIDLVWEVQRDVGAKDAIQVVCGFRSPGTNEMLRRRSRNSGVARFSQHTLGKAMDFYLPDARLEDVRAAGLRLQRGGVGFYPTSGSPFVHLDVGSVRHWPRMTRDQLVKVFPDGRTVHIPSDGKPLPGYALALADIEKRGGEPSAMSLAAANDNGVQAGGKRSLLARLFGFSKNKSDEDEDAVETEAPAVQTAHVAPLQAKPVSTQTLKPSVAALSAPPMPKARPAAPQAIAQAPQATLQPTAYRVASAAPSDAGERRAIWRSLTSEQPAAAQQAEFETIQAATQVALAEPKQTGSIGPWPAPATLKDRIGGDTALAYAIPAEPKIVRRAVPSARVAAPATAPGMTVAIKTEAQAMLAQAPATPTATAGMNDPWLRAIVLAPNLRSYMSTTIMGEPDMRALRPMLERPSQAVSMTFSDDPLRGMIADSFGGEAIVFVATTSFANRTASLR